MHPLSTFALLCLVAPSAFAAADDASLLRCRGLNDASARLACYDALPVAGAPARSTVPVAAASGPATQAQRDFGLAPAVVSRGAAEAVESRVAGRFEGWDAKNVLITLTNGQVWRVVDGSTAFKVMDSPKVTIERGTLGAFYMVVDGLSQRPRVRRER